MNTEVAVKTEAQMTG